MKHDVTRYEIVVGTGIVLLAVVIGVLLQELKRPMPCSAGPVVALFMPCEGPR